MSRLVRVAAVAAAVIAAAGGCTLLLPTDELITPCTVQQDCDDALGAGFECKENACLPVDQNDGAEGEGEGEGE